MAEFCRQCSEALGHIGDNDLAGLCKPGEIVDVICEGCGFTCVDHEGNCVGPCGGEYPDNKPHPIKSSGCFTAPEKPWPESAVREVAQLNEVIDELRRRLAEKEAPPF